MKIITWNCNMAFRRKAHMILAHKPDILVIQECEHPDKLKFDDPGVQPTDMLWFGDNRNKGLGIFSFSDLKLRLHRSHNPELKLIAPIRITNQNTDFLLYAIWAHNPGDPDGQYVEQTWKAIQHYQRLIRKNNTILIGDFNSNTIWDRPRRAGNHSTVVDRLAMKSIHSLYHHHHGQIQGKEAHPTLYLYKNQGKPYHIDYCFASSDWIEKLSNVEIGKY